MKRLRSLLRRLIDCRRGQHLETIVWDFGILTWHCVDCGSRRWIGSIDRWGSNKKPHPWEHGDA